jgi:hypothetical protein
MQWDNVTSPKHHFYFDSTGNKKYNGIYCPGIDRWLLIDQYDYWVTLQTAQVLSSKIATMVYVLPPVIGAMTNDNCMNFSIFDKTSQKKGPTGPDLITSQIPTMRILTEPRQLVERGIPEDYKNIEGVEMLDRLKQYADFVQRCMYAAMLCGVYVNYHDNKTFADMFLPKEWTEQVWMYADRSDVNDGVLPAIRKVLYNSNTLTEARDGIANVWDESANKVIWLKNFFERILDEQQDESIQ